MGKGRKVVVVVVLGLVLGLALTCGLLVHYLAHHTTQAEVLPKFIPCSNECTFTLVESIPVGLTYPPDSPVHPATGPTILNLLNEATESVHVASSYWSLLTGDTSPTDPVQSQQGVDVFNALHAMGVKGGVKVKIVQNKPDGRTNDTIMLAKTGSIEVRSMDFTRLIGAGILHTKMWIIDGRHFYVGSANLDWRSYTEVKELGVVVSNCSCLARDMDKIFQVYWDLAAEGAVVPKAFPLALSARFNVTKPMSLSQNRGDNNRGTVYLSSSPPQFCPQGRTSDIDAILNVIAKAKSFIYIAVMDYLPAIIYQHPNRYWPVIDDALRTASFDRKVEVHLLVSHWNHTPYTMFDMLQSLQDLNRLAPIEVRAFEVPANAQQKLLPYSRVNHNKYMVTDQHAYIGTSNWSGDYFTSTAGVGFIMEQPRTPNVTSSDVRQQLENIFLRDWNSNHTQPLSKYANHKT